MFLNSTSFGNRSAAVAGIALLLATAGLGSTAPAHADLGKFAGDWITPNGATVRIRQCGKEPCGRIIRFTPPPGYTMKSTPDLNNRDKSKRNRKVLGLKVLFRMKQSGNSLTGRVYDPRRGISAKATVTQSSARTLTVKGCVRVLFEMCEKETWRRAR